MATEGPSLDPIFCAAIEIESAEERAAYIVRASGDDLELRSRVEKLVAAHLRAGSFLEQPALGAAVTGPEARPPAADSPAGEIPGARIGPYKLMEQIGEGGMGTVWMAEQQEPVRRRVALKVIKAGMDSAQVIARFEAERQALALMDHPHIAKVLDAGTTGESEPRPKGSGEMPPLPIGRGSGRPYFVMELVKGTPLTKYCDEHRLTPRQRLELFVPVCQALQHAHQKGIIHRDVKPSNVLVAPYDGKPVVKVIDFGVAKATGQRLTERTLFTGLGAVVGTLEYMSPEQAELNNQDIDTRSDIYSLGVLLYELLTGTTPLDRKQLKQAAFTEMLRIIREEEPPKPSTRLSDSKDSLPSISAQRQMEPAKLTKLVRRELDWIVMKALDKDRNRRYETASTLAADVQRYLRDEPVQACPPTVGYRLKKLVRRHHGKVAAAGVFLMLLLAGTVVSTWQAVRATRAGRAAMAAETQTRDALDALTDDVVERLLAKQPELGDEETAFLRKVLGFYEAFTQQLGETAEARYLRAKGYFKVALLRKRLGERDEALAGFRQGKDLFGQLVADFPDVALYRDKLARSLSYVGDNLRVMGKAAQAETPCRQAVALREALVAEIPAEREYRLVLAHEYKSLIITLVELGKRGEAELACRQAMAICERLVAEIPEAPAYRRELAISYNNLGRLMQMVREHAEAATAYRQSIAEAEKLAAEFPAVPGYREDLARTHNNLGEMLRDQGKYAEAEASLHQALDLCERLVADFPAMRCYQHDLATSQYECGHLLILRGRPAEALAHYDRALSRLQPLHKHEPRDIYVRKDLCNAHKGRARALDALKRHTEAQADWEQALELSPPAEKPSVQLGRDHGWVRAGKVAQAVADADALTKNPATPGGTLYDAACVYAVAVATAQGDTKQQELYAGQALALLRRARARGYFQCRTKVEHLKKDSDLDVLRSQEDFQKLVADLEAAVALSSERGASAP